jgi:hypothetical protein
MVAVVNFSSSLKNVLNYNESKLKQDVVIKDEKGQVKTVKKAAFIHASGYAKDTEKLGYTDKEKRLEKLMRLRESRTKSVAHISLNFDPSEKLDHNRLREIADAYMQKIGFGDQPYLVYEHRDAGHPHIHIVSTIIKEDGGVIETHNIGRNVSEPVRRELEELFGLEKADSRKQKEHFELKPVNAQKAQYGRSETKRAIANVLDTVLPFYKYTSLAELNAVLKQYNVMADQGSEKSRIYKNNGLVYRFLDHHGNKVGVPVKASDIYLKPTMKYLQARFNKNAPLRAPYKQRIKNAIDLALMKRTVATLQDLQAALKKDSIQLVLRHNKDGSVGGLTVVDHLKKVVFKGSDLHKNYSANAIQERLKAKDQTVAQSEPLQTEAKQESRKPQTEQQPTPTPKSLPQPKPKPRLPKGEEDQPIKQGEKQMELPFTGTGLLEALVKPEPESDGVPFEQPTKKKKRKKKRLHL